MPIQITVMSLDFDSSGKPITKVYDKDEVTLGRETNNDVVLGRPEVSAQHAKLRVDDQGNGREPTLLITDLGSSNGTMVENLSLRPQQEVPVRANQRIIIGNYLIKTEIVREEDEEEVAEEEVEEEAQVIPETVTEEPSVEPEEEPEEEPSGVSGFVARMLARERKTEESDLFAEEETPTEEEPQIEEEPQPAEEEIAAEEVVAVEEEIPTEEETLAEKEIPVEEAAPFEEAAQPEEEAPIEEEVQPEEELPAEEEVVEEQQEEEEIVQVDQSVLEPQPEVQAKADEGETPMASITVTVDGSDALDLDFIATQLFTFSGTVTHKGKPVEGVEVDIGIGKTVTGSDGSFRFVDIQDGTEYSLTALRDGYSFECGEAAGEVSDNMVLPVLATKLYAITGEVVHKGAPLSGVRIEDSRGSSVVSDQDGTFVFTDVPEDTEYGLTASRDKFIFESNSNTGTVTNEDAIVQFTATQLFTLSGRVIHKGEPLEGVEIDGGELGKTTTDADGVWRFEDVPEGKDYTITAAKEGFVLGK